MAHVLVVPYPSQGHMNPMVQFAKNLASKGVATTLVTTHFIARTAAIDRASPVQVEAISDGHDEGGYPSAASLEEYLAKLEVVGSASLAELVVARARSGSPVTCVVHDTLTRWAARTARGLGVPAAVSFFMQSCAVSAVYRCVNEGELAVPPASDVGARSAPLAGLPEIDRWEFPSFALRDGSYPMLAALALTQFADKGKDDWVLFNSFEELEGEDLAGLASHWKARAMGPCVPLPTAESRAADNVTYNADVPVQRLAQALNQYVVIGPPAITKSCRRRRRAGPALSVVRGLRLLRQLHVLDAAQMEEVARGPLAAGKPFLWVVRETDEAQLPRHLPDEATASGDALVVRWSPQLDVLAHRTVGCFITHCGWNSTLEALCFGVPMMALPLWTDQPTSAHFVEREWGAGVRARMFLRGEIERCVRAVMDGDGTAASARDAAVSPGGSSDRNVEEFVAFVRAGAGKKGKAPVLEGSETAASEM